MECSFVTESRQPRTAERSVERFALLRIMNQSVLNRQHESAHIVDLVTIDIDSMREQRGVDTFIDPSIHYLKN
jgi:hypothetical protein